MNTNQQFQELANEHGDRIYSFARYWLGNREDAEDVTQEILVRLWRCRDAVPHERLPLWLMRVTRNACIDAARKRTAHQRLQSPVGDEVLVGRVADPAPTAADALCTADSLEQIGQVIAELDEPQRSIVLLRDVQNMSYSEITTVLDLSLDQVRVYLHRARRKIRERLRERVSHGEI